MSLHDLGSQMISKAAALWDYLSSFASTGPADAIVLCCSYDLRVCDYACELLRLGLAPQLVISGNTGNWTKHLWHRPEAHVFRERALACGAPSAKILVEDRATNFGENVRLSRTLIPNARRVLFVTKPAAVLRVKLTVEAQWPTIDCRVSGPPIRFPDEVSNVIGILGVIHEMVGDIQRIQRYPALGYQSAHELPASIVSTWQALIDDGFTHHLLP